MQHLSPEGRKAVSDIASRYRISSDAVEHMLIAVNNGSGSMAQFNCPELGGSGQWMRGGMTMVGDMFNNGLKSTVDNLCNELSNLLASTQVFPEIPSGTPGSRQWWPTDLGTPFSSGSQNNTRYAVFAGRLAVEANGQVTVYDTLDHQIGGVSQQQGNNSSLTFSSQYGTVPVSTLPVVSGDKTSSSSETSFGAAPTQDSTAAYSTGASSTTAGSSSSQSDNPAQPGSGAQTGSGSESADFTQKHTQGNDSGSDIIALIEKLAQLHSAGVLNDEEFGAKKQELLKRL